MILLIQHVVSYLKIKDENENENNSTIKCTIYPCKKQLEISLNKQNNFTIGGHIYNLPIDKSIQIDRATRNNKKSKGLTNILVKCIDDNINSKISLSIVKDCDRYIDETTNLSARSYATLVITPELTIQNQKKLVSKFNKFLNKLRNEYHSLFLTNYRESNTIARKRISFKLVFNIVNYLLNNLENQL